MICVYTDNPASVSSSRVSLASTAAVSDTVVVDVTSAFELMKPWNVNAKLFMHAGHKDNTEDVTILGLC
jgi:hypothetical protein